jgi:glycosyltransferase involved in cell wall biosynthesis
LAAIRLGHGGRSPIFVSVRRQVAEEGQGRTSVVIPLYNHGRFIEAAIESVLQQGSILRELIVVDDGSTDDSAAIARRLAETDPRIVFWSQPNRGAHAAINAGVQRASGELVGILNSDDVYEPGRLKRLAAALDAEPTADLAASGISFIDDMGNPVPNTWYDAAVEFADQSRDLAVALINGNFLMTTSNYLIRRRLFDQLGLFAPLRYAHDLDFALRILAEGKSIRFVREPLLQYRLHACNTINEAHDRVRLEWAAVAAMYVVRAWDYPRANGIDWTQVVAMEDVWSRHALTRPVHLCVTYLRRHPTDTMERTPLLHDGPFLNLLRKCLR